MAKVDLELAFAAFLKNTVTAGQEFNLLCHSNGMLRDTVKLETRTATGDVAFVDCAIHLFVFCVLGSNLILFCLGLIEGWFLYDSCWQIE